MDPERAAEILANADYTPERVPIPLVGLLVRGFSPYRLAALLRLLADQLEESAFVPLSQEEIDQVTRGTLHEGVMTDSEQRRYRREQWRFRQ